MSRFFGKSENIGKDTIIIDGGDYNHIKNVLRMKIGDEITVTGGNNNDYRCTIEGFKNDEVIAAVDEIIPNDRELPARIHLFQGIPKGDKMELIIQKCVELGVSEIIPVSMKRCVAKYDSKKAASKIARFRSISESAAKQSGRSIIPEIKEPLTYDEAIKYASGMDIKLVPYELAESMDETGKAIRNIKHGMDVAVFIGPEGGFDGSEIDKAIENDFSVISLGKRILRTETAGLAVMSILMYHLETER